MQKKQKALIGTAVSIILIVLALAVLVYLFYHPRVYELTFSGTGGLEGVTYKGITIHGVTCPITVGDTVSASASWGGVNGPLGSVITWIDTQGAATYPYADVSSLSKYCPSTTTSTTTTQASTTTSQATTTTSAATTTTLCPGCGNTLQSFEPSFWSDPFGWVMFNLGLIWRQLTG